MRMEGKISYFKRAAQTSNFKNVPYTVAKRHQRLLCGYLLSGNFFDQQLQMGPGLYNNLELIFPIPLAYSSKQPKTILYGRL